MRAVMFTVRKKPKAVKQKLIPTLTKNQKAVVAKNIQAIMDLKVVIKTMLTVPNIENIITKNQKAVVAKIIQAITDLKVVIKIMLIVLNIESIITQKMVKSHSGHSAHSSKCFFSHLLSFKDKLQLNDAQVDSIKKMRFDYRKTIILLTADKEVAKMEFDQLVHSKTVDVSAIRAAGEKIIAVKTKKIRTKVEAKIAVMKLLTDEQRNQVHKMHSSH